MMPYPGYPAYDAGVYYPPYGLPYMPSVQPVATKTGSTNQTILVFDDEEYSMEERRAMLPKYQT